MNSKIPLILLGAVAISASSFADTLTYGGSATGSFYDGAYWGGTKPSETSDIVFDDKAKATAYVLDATKGVTVNSITDNSIIDRTLEGDAQWGKNIIINIGESTFTILEDLTLASNHNNAPFSFAPGSDGVGEVVVKGNIISQLAKEDSGETSGESLFGNGGILKSLTVGGNIELEGSKLRFHALNVNVKGVVNFTGDNSNTQLNLAYGSMRGQTVSISFGGLNGINKEIKFGGWENSLVENSTITLSFTNSGTSRFSGNFNHDGGGSGSLQNNIYNLVMNGTSTGVQYYQEDTDTKFSFNNVTVKSGKLNFYSEIGKSVIYLEGGTLSPATVAGEIAILKAEAINWDNGKISFNLVEENNVSDKIVLDYALTKTSFSVPGGTREIELIFDNPSDIAAWIDASEDGKLTYTLIEYGSTNFENGDIVFSQIDGINIEYNFGDKALTVTLSKVPEPATIAAIFGACALAMAAFRRRRK